MEMLDKMREEIRVLDRLLDEKLEKIPDRYRMDAIEVRNDLAMKYNFLGIRDVETRDWKIIEAFIVKLEGIKYTLKKQ